jgi:hypothetical protein
MKAYKAYFQMVRKIELRNIRRHNVLIFLFHVHPIKSTSVTEKIDQLTKKSRSRCNVHLYNEKKEINTT